MSAPKLGFTILSEAWYANTVWNSDFKDEVMFGLYHEDGGTGGEMAMRWVPLGSAFDEPKYVPQLQVFDDAWSVLTMIPKVLAELGDLNGQNITPTQFSQVLLDQGFVDMTDRENPRK